MTPHRWQKSSYCQEGDACVHIAAAPDAIHFTDRPEPPHPTLTLTPTAFRTFLRALKGQHLTPR
ncbi:DUF397 domain-containing protein [Streptomyces flavalbus]|uniref:DUF397 domain-containing protein n=1 Tax=Streptomyces flavalbus TaxID=2665155 RepID=A0ABW2W8F1_9ACTN